MSGKAKILVSRGKKKSLLWKARVLCTRAELASGIMHSPRHFEPALFLFPSVSRWRNAIHSFFCPPFDAVFVDEKRKVLNVVRVAPNNLLVVPRARAKYLLELPAGEAERKRLKIGEKLSFSFS